MVLTKSTNTVLKNICLLCWVSEVGSLGVRTAPRVDRPCDGAGGANMAALQWLAGFHLGNWETEITTEGQGYLDELAADGNTAPKAAMTGSSTFRIKCGDDGFHQDSLDVPHQSRKGKHRALTKKKSTFSKFASPLKASSGYAHLLQPPGMSPAPPR